MVYKMELLPKRKEFFMRGGAIFALLLAIALLLGYAFVRYTRTVVEEVSAYFESVYRIERGFIEHYPVYEDYATHDKETALRHHLLPDHLKQTVRSGMPAISETKEIEALVSEGRLVAVETGRDVPFYFYNVPRTNRYMTPETKAGLDLITKRFRELLVGRHPESPVVKIAISSALRPTSYQQKLRKRNGNASLVSSHSYGISIDLFYDDFFVALPEPPEEMHGTSKLIIRKLRRQIGFLLGDALSRQFRSMLMETLLQLQDEGLIYAILEKRQRCYHVTVLPGSVSSLQKGI